MEEKISTEQNNLLDNSISSFVCLKDINKVYENGFQAVYDFNLDVEKHSFVALVGPSGCGKSTTLRMIAGLEEISSGYLYINKILSNYLPSKDRDIAMVFQSYALYPQLTVYDNIAFGLKIRKIDPKEIEERVFSAAKILGLGTYLDCKPKQLSGGQMQRVALGRAIVRNASIFLMDEPLSNLDAKLRVQMRSEIVRIHEAVGATTIYVTHDQTEAMTMADKIVVMNKGFIQQVGSPMEVYQKPNNLFVATFIGSPAMNLLNGTIVGNKLLLNGGVEIELSEEIVKNCRDFYLSKINKYRSLVGQIDNLSIAELEKERKLINSHKIVIEKTEIIHKKKKTHWWNKLSDWIKNKKEMKSKDAKEILYKEDFKSEFSSKMNDDTKFISDGFKIKVGIRPENLFKISDNKPNTSKPIELNVDMVEILGSEYIVYGKIEDQNIIFKTDTSSPISPHSKIQIAIDVTKINLFDEDSGENINLIKGE